MALHQLKNDSLAVVTYTRKTITVPTGTTVSDFFPTPEDANYSWYCINVNPATTNINVLSYTAGGNAQLQNIINNSDTHTYTAHWLGIHK